ncbi:MAG: hypothetical protein C3F11_13775 [Methylocystaceae bacterium]|nr:MAG: hypothetical protein C3F11_13775 [Methylocystaceae bacterium]
MADQMLVASNWRRLHLFSRRRPGHLDEVSRPVTLRPMLKTLAYPLAIERYEKEGGYLAYFPSLPGCQTWGETYEAAVHNAEEALAIYIETLTANGDPIPEPNTIEGPVSLGVMVRADVAA